MRFGTSAVFVTALLLMAEAATGASSGVAVSEHQYGFSFTLPANLKQVPLNGSDVTNLLNTATHDDPALANALDSEVTSAAAKGTKVFAIGPISGSSVPNVNVIVSSSAGVPTGRAFAQEAATEAKIELAQIKALHVKTSVVTNRLGATAEATYEIDVKGSSPQFGEQFYVQHKAYVDILTVTTPSSTATRSNAQRIVASWHW